MKSLTILKTVTAALVIAVGLNGLPVQAKHRHHHDYYRHQDQQIYVHPVKAASGIVDLAACARPNEPNANMDLLCNRQNQADYR